MSKTLSEIKDSLPADRREKIEQRYEAIVDELREIVAENERLRAELEKWKAGGKRGTIAKWKADSDRLAEAEQALRDIADSTGCQTEGCRCCTHSAEAITTCDVGTARAYFADRETTND